MVTRKLKQLPVKVTDSNGISAPTIYIDNSDIDFHHEKKSPHQQAVEKAKELSGLSRF